MKSRRLRLNGIGSYRGRYEIEGDVCIGRGPENDIVIDDPSISSTHCIIRMEEQGYVLSDLQSTNGTIVNDEGVESATLEEGDKLSLGDIEFEVHLAED